MPDMDDDFTLSDNSCFSGRNIEMNKTIENLARKTPDQILAECGQNDTVPVDLGALLRHYDISAMAMDFSEIEKLEGIVEDVRERGHILGAVIAGENKTAIFYSSDTTFMTDHRYRFTVAHELGHLCGGVINHIEFRHDGDSMEKNEVAANIFAGELLIPRDQLVKIAGQLFVPTIKSLASVFEVSETVMAARLDYLRRRGHIIEYI